MRCSRSSWFPVFWAMILPKEIRRGALQVSGSQIRARERSRTLKIGPLDRNADRHQRRFASSAQLLKQVRIGKDDGLAVYP